MGLPPAMRVRGVARSTAAKILQGELLAVGARPGAASNALFDLASPELDWVSLAASMGVEGRRVETLEAFADVFTAATARRGPFLVELRI